MKSLFFYFHKKGHTILFVLFLSFSFLLTSLPITMVQAKQTTPPIIILSCTKKTLNIHEQLQLSALITPTQEKSLRYKSSDSKIASVSANGLVQAKKGGSCKITASLNGAEAYCNITVRKTTIQIAKSSISLEHGESFALNATSSNNTEITYKSNRTSVAIVSDDGVITGCKPGDAFITVKADQTKVLCKVTVKKPTIKIDQLYTRLYRCYRKKLTATVSSGLKPTWKSSCKSVAIINEDGVVTALKHGSSIISAKVDGVTQTCLVVVESPEIKLSATALTLSVGKTATLDAEVSSKNAPVFSSSKPSIASVDQLGNIIAKKAGKTTISVKEDGTTARCKVTVLEK